MGTLEIKHRGTFTQLDVIVLRTQTIAQGLELKPSNAGCARFNGNFAPQNLDTGVGFNTELYH